MKRYSFDGLANDDVMLARICNTLKHQVLALNGLYTERDILLIRLTLELIEKQLKLYIFNKNHKVFYTWEIKEKIDFIFDRYIVPINQVNSQTLLIEKTLNLNEKENMIADWDKYGDYDFFNMTFVTYQL